MSKELRLLYVEDDKENRDGLTEILSDEIIGDYILKIDTVDSFDNAFDIIVKNNYHIIILDLFKETWWWRRTDRLKNTWTSSVS